MSEKINNDVYKPVWQTKYELPVRDGIQKTVIFLKMDTPRGTKARILEKVRAGRELE